MSNGKTELLKTQIQQDFPDLVINSIKVIGTGWHHNAVDINGSIIFRIPHHTYGHDITPVTVNYETELLKRLKGKVPVSIPDPRYIAPNNDYFGYPKLSGVLLQDITPVFNQEDWQYLKKDWVAIASAIHQNVSINVARSLKIPDFEQPGPHAVERIFSLPNISSEVLYFASTIIEQVKTRNKDTEQHVFIHNDLQFHNILADPKTKRITGLIDWTDACVGPLAREFSIDEWMQEDLLKEVAELYEEKTGIHVDVQQAFMWRSFEELGDYVEEIESKEVEEAAKTLKRIKHLITTK
jgi:aminoglycoside phosphotransferase (APT) family kinase protein